MMIDDEFFSFPFLKPKWFSEYKKKQQQQKLKSKAPLTALYCATVKTHIAALQPI